MMDDILTDLGNYAMQHGIGVQLTDKLDPYTPSNASTETRIIVINTNYYNQRQIPLQTAHEIGHIINGDHSIRALYYTPARTGIEYNASVTALTLLAPYYLEDKPDEYIDVDDFMEMFAIPEHLRNVAEQVLLEID